MKTLVAYITTGYPDCNFTIDLAHTLSQNGVDMLELGMPFSDPVADGPVIEKANLLALQKGYRLEDLYRVTEAISQDIKTLWMGYFNSFYHQGFEAMCKRANELGASGFIIPDLPTEEARSYNQAAKANSIDLISFLAPTHSANRIEMISKDATGFIYLVAYAGITGSNQSESLDEIIQEAKRHTQTPIYIGFGVNADNAKKKVQGVDGVIVGSEFIKLLLDDSLSSSQKISRCGQLAATIKEQINS